MKHILVISLACQILLFSGCDAFRTIAGKPTSSDIEAKKEKIEAKLKAAHEARLDSLRRIEKSLADSAAVMDSIKKEGGTILNPGAMGGLTASKLDYRYYIVVGAFANPENAESLLAKAREAGYIGIIITFKNGFNAVGLSQTDHIEKAYSALQKLKGESFCPQDAWILVNE